VTLVSEQNYTLFTPLLPQVASSTVEPRHIIQPIRDVLGHRRFRFRRDRVTGIDLAGRRVLLAIRRSCARRCAARSVCSTRPGADATPHE
jgi:NADH dehydrogenase FAD-containing subunit